MAAASGAETQAKMIDQTRSPARPELLRNVLLACCAGVAGIALMGLAGGLAGQRLLDSSLAYHVPMALSTALLFLALGGVLATAALRGPGSAGGRIAGALVLASLCVALLNLAGRLTGLEVGLPDLLFLNLQNRLGVPFTAMSPATATLFALACLGVWPPCSRVPGAQRPPHGLSVAGVLGAFVALWGFIFLLGYVYGTPLLYATGLVPVARSTALAFLLLGVALVCAAGRDLLPLRLFSGPSVQALLLRAFLPVIVGLSLLHSLLLGHTGFGLGQGNALLAASIAVGYAVATGLVILHVSRRVGSALDNSERLRSEAERIIHSALDEKTVMLKEIHHRVKNNMQVVSSLLTLQMEYVLDSRDRILFEESRNRIQSMAMVHEELYRDKDLSSVDMGSYVPRLVERVISGTGHDVHVEFAVQDLHLSITQSVPCGLLLNELVMNAVKHAFPHADAAWLRVGLRREAGWLVLTMEDNGPGLPPGFDPKDTSTLGMALMTSLAEQLRGVLLAENAGRGARFTLRFPLEP